MQRVLSRDATVAEQSVLLGGLQRNLQLFSQSTDSQNQTLQLLSVGQSSRDSQIDAGLHAGWTVVCLTVLNLDETLNHE